MLHLIFILELVSLLIGVGRFRILRGGQGLEYCVRGGGGGGGQGGQGGPVPSRHNDVVISTSCAH